MAFRKTGDATHLGIVNVPRDPQHTPAPAQERVAVLTEQELERLRQLNEQTSQSSEALRHALSKHSK